MIVYKKVRKLKNGNYYPLFIGKTKKFEMGVKMRSEYLPTNGFAERSIGKNEDGTEMGGWHSCPLPTAPWIADELKSGEQRVWMECEAENVVEYQRKEGTWYLSEFITPLRILTNDEVKNILVTV